MRRSLILQGLPLLVVGSAVLAVWAFALPIVPSFSYAQYRIPNQHYFYHTVNLDPGQRAELQFSSNVPLDFYILDKENYNIYLQGEAYTALVASLGEFHNTHSFTSTRADVYVFILDNRSGADANVALTFSRSLDSLEFIGIFLLGVGVAFVLAGLAMKTKALDVPSKVLEIVRTRGQVPASELAFKFSTTEQDIQLALLRLRLMGEPVIYNPATREASYNPHPGEAAPLASTTSRSI